MLAVALAVTEKYRVKFVNPLSHIIRTPVLPFKDNFDLDLSYLLKAFVDLTILPLNYFMPLTIKSSKVLRKSLLCAASAGESLRLSTQSCWILWIGICFL